MESANDEGLVLHGGSTVKQWHCMTTSCSSPLEAISGRTEGRWCLLATCTSCHRDHLVSKSKIALLSTGWSS